MLGANTLNQRDGAACFLGPKRRKQKKEDIPASLANLDEAIALLNQFSHPQLVEQWASQTGWVRAAEHGFRVTFPFAANSIAEALKDWLSAQSDTLAKQFDLTQRVAPLKAGEKNACKWGEKSDCCQFSERGRR